MKKLVLLSVSLFLLAALAACSGSDGQNGAVGPSGSPGSPQPIKALVLGVWNGDANVQIRAVWLTSANALPAGSTVNWINALDSIPPLSVLNTYDAVWFVNNNTPVDAVGLGDRLADYVSGGGRLVMAQGSWSNPFSIGGRILDAAFSPYTTAAGAGDGATKAIDQTTLVWPLHPMLVGVDIVGYTRVGLTALSVPGVRPDATTLFLLSGGIPGAAISASGRIVAVNDFPLTADQDIYKLVGNAMLYLSGNL